MENINSQLDSPFSDKNPIQGRTAIKDWCSTEPVYLFTDTYRTIDGQAIFTFGFAHKNDLLEIDILSMPSYEGRLSDNNTTHRSRSDRDKFQIDVGDPRIINNNASAKNLAAKWAELTWKYIRTGLPF